MAQHPLPKRIALVHAGPVSVLPVELACRDIWPEVDRLNLMDDALMRDRARSPELTQDLHDRIRRLAAYGRDAGADGILFTCSAFGRAIEDAARQATWPVLKPNEAMFEAALEAGRRIGMIASFANSLPGMEAEFEALAAARGVAASIECICVPEAMAALQRDDIKLHNRLIAAAAPRLAHCDAILLAQFSTSQAADEVAASVAVPVLTSPAAAVRKLKRLLSA